MRIAILVSPSVGYVVGTIHNSGTNDLRTYASDRAANGEAFPLETVVRIPRSMARRIARFASYSCYALNELLKEPSRMSRGCLPCGHTHRKLHVCSDQLADEAGL